MTTHTQAPAGSAFSHTNHGHAVTHRRGAVLSTETFATRGEAWAEFMRLGRDPNSHAVRIDVR